MKNADPSNRLFRLMMHIGRGTNVEMPATLAGAYVPVFAAAPDPEAAAARVLEHLAGRGFDLIGIGGGQVDELDPATWDSFVMEAWPAFASNFPTQARVARELAGDFLFVGPFAGYETNKSP